LTRIWGHMPQSEQKTRPMLVGVDFSDSSTAAVEWLCRHFAPGLELVLLHSLVTPELPAFLSRKWPLPDSFMDNARSGAEQRLRDLALRTPDARISTRVALGRPAECLADAARELHADLIAVGKHGQRGRVRGATGSTPDRLVRISPVPVLMIGGNLSEAPKRILVALTFSSITPLVVEWTSRLSEHFSANVFGVHVIASAVLGHVLSMSEVTQGKSLTEPEIESVFSEENDRWRKQLLDAGIPRELVKTEIAFGDVGQEVLAVAGREGADIIVMGSHASAVRRALLGSSASAVLREAEIPVLVVVAPDDE
jgi:nucleotide-binding universal stress UspA family protein